MASISREPGGRKRIQFVDAEGTRKSIRLGKTSMRIVEQVKFRIERLLEAKITGHAVDTDMAKWVSGLLYRSWRLGGQVGPSRFSPRERYSSGCVTRPLSDRVPQTSN